MMEIIMPFDEDLDTTEKLTLSHEYMDVIIRQLLTSNVREFEALPISQDLEVLINDISSDRPVQISDMPQA
jgi:hypothetical protein